MWWSNSAIQIITLFGSLASITTLAIHLRSKAKKNRLLILALLLVLIISVIVLLYSYLQISSFSGIWEGQAYDVEHINEDKEIVLEANYEYEIIVKMEQKRKDISFDGTLTINDLRIEGQSSRNKITGKGKFQEDNYARLTYDLTSFEMPEQGIIGYGVILVYFPQERDRAEGYYLYRLTHKEGMGFGRIKMRRKLIE